MALNVNTNIFAINAQRNVARTQGSLSTAMQRLSSGLRINAAKDDAAGLGMAMLQDGQARGFEVAQRTIGDGMSFLQVADNSFRTMDGILQRMRELAVQYNSGTYSADQQGYMATEFSQLKLEVSAVQGRTVFNDSTVFGVSKAIQAGANTEIITVLAESITATAVITDVTTVDSDLKAVASALALVGSYQSRLEKAFDGAMAMEESQRASYGRIMDADFARETMRMTSAQVVQQAGISALAQANTIPQLALSLLR